VQLSAKYLRNPERISVGSANKAAVNIKQDIVYITDDEKYGVLLKEIAAREGSILIFVKTKIGAGKLTDKLNRQRLGAEAIHGDLEQRDRERVIQGFRDQKHRVLVATDIASRGLDIPHIEHVINYDLPHAPEDYIHRIGRTARAGAEGSSLCLISPDDHERWVAIHKLLYPGEPLPAKHPSAHEGRSGNGGGGQKRRRFNNKPRGGGAPRPAA